MEKENKKEESKKEEDIIGNILEGMFQASRKETQEERAEEIDKMIECVKEPEEYHFRIDHPVKRILSEALDKKFPGLDKANFAKLTFLYEHYFHIKVVLEDIISKKEGWICSADKSYKIIHELLKFYTKGTFELKPFYDEKTNATYDYHLPKFWNENEGKEWIEYFEALFDFYHGKANKYLEFLKNNLMPLYQQIQAEIEEKKKNEQ